jgi:hypothetical protein
VVISGATIEVNAPQAIGIHCVANPGQPGAGNLKQVKRHYHCHPSPKLVLVAKILKRLSLLCRARSSISRKSTPALCQVGGIISKTHGKLVTWLHWWGNINFQAHPKIVPELTSDGPGFPGCLAGFTQLFLNQRSDLRYSPYRLCVCIAQL